MNKEKLIAYLKHFGVIFLVSIVIGFILIGFFCSNCFSDYRMLTRAFLFNFLITIVLWLGNGSLVSILDRYFPWLDRPRLRLIISIAVTIVFTSIAFIFINAGYSSIFLGNDFMTIVKATKLSYLTTPIVITFIISLFMHGNGFFQAWKNAITEAEALKRENLASQYETLKNQVNPHFLFNSLNALSSLVYIDADLSAKFIKQLSKVYRHVLDTKDKEIVPLSVEIKALKAYLFLLEIRYGDNFKTKMTLPNIEKYTIVPLALQMLVENAVKHNIISRSKPLTIDIYIEDEYIIVKNNLQIKDLEEASSGIGLENIKSRYQYIANQSVIVTPTTTEFIVKLPLLPTIH